MLSQGKGVLAIHLLKFNMLPMIGGRVSTHYFVRGSKHACFLLGMNIVSRDTGSGGEAQVEEWKREFRPSLVHGIFLNEASISTKHAALCKPCFAVQINLFEMLVFCEHCLTEDSFFDADLEDRGNFCFVKDLGSRNKVLSAVLP